MKHLLLWGLLLCLACTPKTKTYTVKKTGQEISITGSGTDKAWENANVLTDFSYPWDPAGLPATTFRALWSDRYFYFLYHVEDAEIITPQRDLGELDAVESDRVEIFFKSSDVSKPYYSLEMDALGRHLDSEGIFGEKVDFDWNWPKADFVLKASQIEDGYIVEGSISLASLRDLGLYQDDGILHAGLYRGEYYHKEADEVAIKWISWVLANTDKPNFHIPDSFGILKLEN